MKTTLITLALVAVASAALAQGKVTFGNDASHLFNLATPRDGDANGPIPVSPLPSGSTMSAALYAGTTSGSLLLQASFALDAANWLTAGRMANKSVILFGVPGGAVANFEIVMTDALPGTLPVVIAGGHFPDIPGTRYSGSSGLFTATPGASLSYPGLVSGGPAGSTWVRPIDIFDRIPEPSSMVLVGFGAALLLILRRRS